MVVFADCEGRGIKCCLFDLVTERVTVVLLIDQKTSSL